MQYLNNGLVLYVFYCSRQIRSSAAVLGFGPLVPLRSSTPPQNCMGFFRYALIPTSYNLILFFLVITLFWRSAKGLWLSIEIKMEKRDYFWK